MVFSGGEIVFLAIFSAIGFANGKFAIVEPYPPPQGYPIEFTSTQVTCIAFDPSGSKTPEAIQFVRKDNFAIYTNLTANENIYFTNRTEENGRKLFVTFHIRSVNYTDDSQYGPLGRYECHAFAVGDPTPVKRGFNLNVIRSNEIPKVLTAKVNVLQHGKEGRIYCNITDIGSKTTQLKKMLWLKDDKVVHDISNPNPANPNPLVIRNAGVKDAGNYTCVLEAFLRQIKGYNVTDVTTVNIAPWIELKGEEHAHVGENLTLLCNPQGVPIPENVEWKLKKENDEVVTACVDSSTNKRYKISSNETYDPYLLSIVNLHTTDSGDYFCCLPSNCSTNTTEDLCQQLTLSVTIKKQVAPWIELKGEEHAHVGENLTLLCNPQGVPIPENVEWKLKKENDEVVTACVDSSTNKRYKISNNGTYDPYLLSIVNLHTTDSGDYFCCLPSNCSTNTTEDLCQQLTLSVTIKKQDITSDGTKFLASWGVVLSVVAFFVFRSHF